MRNNRLAVAFVVLLWTMLLLLMAHDAYKKILKIELPSEDGVKTMEELLNGNP